MVARTETRRVFRTVLFTDIVGSTEMAAQLGDRRWRKTVTRHHAVIRRELRRHHGREIDTAGDGFFAVFESPTDAVRCASAVLAAVHGLGLRIRAGIHTGEVEPAGDKVGGIAVHIGARLLAVAGPEEVLVSNTVRDLTAGSGHEFEDRGEHELKGVPGRWRVFALVLPRLDQSIAVGAAEEEEERLATAARRQRLVIAGLVAVVAVLTVSAGAYIYLGSRPPLPVTGPGTAVEFGPAQTQPLAGWRVGRGPEALAFADGVLWVANLDDGTVAKVDPSSGDVVTLGQAGPHPSGLLALGGQVWVTDRYSDLLSILAADTGTLLKQLPIHATALAGDDQAVWAADDLGDRLVHLDPRGLSEVGAIALPAPAGPSALVTVGGTVWVASPRAKGLLRVDAASGKVTVEPLDIAAVTSIATLGDDLWIASRTADVVARLDARTGRLAVRADVCDTPVDLAPIPGGVWVACAAERALWRLDASGTVLDTITLDGVPTSLATEGERVWVALRAD
jgi:class 3 adenylate cyclase/streptogramin lyase